MKVLLAIFGILAVLAVPVWLMTRTGIDTGRDGSHPLGRFEVMDEFLREKGLERSERPILEAECPDPEVFLRLRDHPCYEYFDSMRQEQMRHRVVIAVDDRKQVVAVGGCFFSATNVWSTAGTRAENFLAHYWKEVVGSEPRFEKLNKPGVDLDEYLLAKVERPSWAAFWRKEPTSGNASHTRTLHDTLLVYRK